MQDVLELVETGLSFEDILRDYYPDLEMEDIQACIHYAIEIIAVEDIHITTIAA